MEQDELFDDASLSIKKRLCGLFGELGAVSLDVLWKEAVARGIADEGTQAYCLEQGGKQLCRVALKQETEKGIPFAKAISRGPGAVWKQLDMFTREEAIWLLEQEDVGIRRDFEKLYRLWEYLNRRHGDIAKPVSVVAFETATEKVV